MNPMNTSTRIRRPLFGVIASALLASTLQSPDALAQSYSFDSGNDQGWTRYEPLKPFGIGAIFSFPNGAYRIQMNPTPNPATFGPARAGSFFPAKAFERVQVETDVFGWDDSQVQSFGVVARADNLGPGTTTGYTFNYNPRSGFHQVTLVNDELPAAPVNESLFRLRATDRYRMVLTAAGTNFVGHVFASTNLTVPIHSVAGRDSTHVSGRTGLFAFGIEATSRLDARFDNFAVTIPDKLRAAFLDATPASGEVFTEPAASVVVRLAHLETSVQIDSIRLEIDGASAPFDVVDLDPILILTHTPNSPLDPSKPHAGTIRFTDEDGERTVSWSFGAPVSGPTLLVATGLDGPFAADTTATLDAATGTFTLPIPNGTRFYRLSGPGSPVISSVDRTGNVFRLGFR
jgi:hypothetical protein